MKKNISINISGIIFHIEEDAYERLRDYLGSINQYFSSFDDSLEIIADIESRIAEIFLAKLNENKQVINKEDVDDLITTMGSIKDFQAVEDQAIGDDESYDSDNQNQWKDTSSKRLYRDEKRKILSGVCAGIAHYFKIDPLWVRLIFLILFFGSYGTILLVYIIMWIVVPSNLDLSDDKKIKKMYRNPEDKVLGGVAGGIAKYFGVDVAVIRLLFVISIFLGGTGLIAYVILWIILPEARTITDKVQMQGDPVTLSNIESNIKKSLKVKDGEEENIFVKILLFPFRLIATIISGIGKALGPVMLFLVDFIRVAFGIGMVMVGLCCTFAVVVCAGILFGVVSSGLWESGFLVGDVGFPVELISDTIPVFTSVAAFFMAIVPCIVFILLGISLVAKRIIFNATVGWSLFAAFIICGIILSVNIPAIVYKFREDGTHKVTQAYDLGNKTAVLTMKEVGMEDYDVTRLTLRGHDESEYKLVQEFESQGSSRRNAIENAQMVSYNVAFEEDSILVFDSNIKFKDDAIFRAQRLDMTLYIPYNKPFQMSENLHHIIYNTIYRSGYRVWDMPNNTWVFTEEGLQCVTCDKVIDEDDDDNEVISMRGDGKSLNFSDFNDLDIASAFVVNINNGRDHRVVVKGEDRFIDKLNIYQDGDKLYVNYDEYNMSDFVKSRDAVTVNITMPELEDLELTGAAKLYINGFKQREMSFTLTGASFVKAHDIKVDNMKIELTGASEMQLQGSAYELTADITGASHLNAYEFEVQRARVEAHGASSARVNVSEQLDIEETLASSVKYKGNAKVKRERWF
ncbi:MAG: PspC domain-containing protein [Fulvivirga sp.]